MFALGELAPRTIRCGILPIATMVTMGETNTTVALATVLSPQLLIMIHIEVVCQLTNLIQHINM